MLARSAVVDEARKRRRHVSLLQRFFQSQQTDNHPSDRESDAHLFVLLEQSISDLPMEERALVERKYFGGESVREIASSLSTTEQAVESRLVRARRRLRELVTVRLKNETSTEN